MTKQQTQDTKETHLNMTAADRTHWLAGTDDPVWIRRLEAVGAELVRVRGEFREYRLSRTQVLVRRAPERRPVSDAQRTALAERLMRGRAMQQAQRQRQ